MLLRLDKISFGEGNNAVQMRHNFTSNVNEIGCYNRRDDLEIRVQNIEEQLKYIMKQTTGSPGN